jgi:ubiquinone/menaquinone biosynthesis C-methylase UbiE
MNLDKYKEIFREFAEDAELMEKNIKSLNLDKESKILDIGTGMGAMATLLALNNFYVLTGEPELDLESHNHGEKFHQHHEEHDDGAWNSWKESAKILGVENLIKFQHFDAQNLPFEDESFDGIFLYDALQHIQDRKLALSECLRILNKDGVIVVIEWSKQQIEKDYKKYGFKIDFIDPQDYIEQKDISIQISKGETINFFIIGKIS